MIARVFPQYIKAFGAYRAALHDWSVTRSDWPMVVAACEATKKDVNGRDGVFRINAANYFDRELCSRAFGKSPKEILDFFKSIYFFHWRHFTFKKAGIIDSESFKKDFESILKDIKIGDLKIPVHITATDLVRGKLKVFGNETKLSDAILASSSFPGMLSPYEINGKLYSDGGILNHFPTDLLQGRCDTMIGIYVSPIQNIEARDLKSIKSVTSRAFDLLYANYNYQKFSLCDWVIEPKELAEYSTFETNKSKMDVLFEIGYLEAKRSYENWNL